MHSINPTKTNSWTLLQSHFNELSSVKMKGLFNKNPNRFNEFNISFDDILVDFSKNRITSETLKLLLKLANEFSGEEINHTEKRAVLHTALRNKSNVPVLVDGADIMPDINKVLLKMKAFSNKVHSGDWKGFTGKKITSIVNIGIGGSDLGPVMVTEALKPYQVEGIETFFVSNVDGTHIVETLKKVSPETTLFLVAYPIREYSFGNGIACLFGFH